jgi:hypothetical protein
MKENNNYAEQYLQVMETYMETSRMMFKAWLQYWDNMHKSWMEINKKGASS